MEPGKLSRYSFRLLAARLGFGSRQWQEISFYSRSALGTLFPWEVKRLGRKADHSPPSSSEVKNGGTVLSLPHDAVLHELISGKMFTFFTIVTIYTVSEEGLQHMHNI
jgi:hypothetical protein